LAILTLGVYIGIHVAGLDRGAETVGAFQVAEPLLNPTPLGASEFHVFPSF
jgi:hypothetical protein